MDARRIGCCAGIAALAVFVVFTVSVHGQVVPPGDDTPPWWNPDSYGEPNDIQCPACGECIANACEEDPDNPGSTACGDAGGDCYDPTSLPKGATPFVPYAGEVAGWCLPSEPCDLDADWLEDMQHDLWCRLDEEDQKMVEQWARDVLTLANGKGCDTWDVINWNNVSLLPPNEPQCQEETDDPEPGPCSGIYSKSPVKLSDGSKSEFSTDIHIALPGDDFEIRRHGTSRLFVNEAGEIRPAGGSLVGANYNLSPFEHMTHAQADPNHYWGVRLHGISSTRSFYAPEVGAGACGDGIEHGVPYFPTDDCPDSDGRYRNSGPSVDFVVPTSIQLEDGAYPTWQLVEPGGWTREFYRHVPYQGLVEPTFFDDVTGQQLIRTPRGLWGLPVREFDTYGNSRHYHYSVYQNEDDPDDYDARLNTIYLNGTHALNSDATVQFNWITDAGDPNLGRLHSIDVRRAHGLVGPITQRVVYTYMDDGNDEYSEALGQTGDLIQVTTFTRTDDALKVPGNADSLWHARVTQYRYHNPGSIYQETTYDTDQDGVLERGFRYQLRMVIDDQQIEYYATRRDLTVLEAAQELLGMDDGPGINSTHTWDDNGTERHVIDLASKVVSEYELEAPRRVLTQYVNNDCACNAGVRSGRKLEYEYGEDEERWAKIKEFRRDDNGDYVHALTTYDDLDIPNEHDPALNPDNVTILRTHAVEDVVSGLIWTEHYLHNDHRQITTSYTPAAVSAFDPRTLAVTLHPDQGRVQFNAYSDATKQRTHSWVARGANVLDEALIERIEYLNPDDHDEELAPYLPARIERFVIADPNGDIPANAIEETTFNYGFYPNSEALAWRSTIHPGVPAVQNGDELPGQTTQLYDARGLNDWVRSTDGTVQHMKHDNTTGEVVHVESNAAPQGIVNPYVTVHGVADWGDGQGNPKPGGTLVTTTTVDILGRPVATTSPAGVTTYTARATRCITPGNVNAPPTGPYYYVTINLPHILHGDPEYSGPARLTYLNARGQAVVAQDWQLTSGIHYDDDLASFKLESHLAEEVARSVLLIDVAGRPAITRSYWNIAEDAWHETEVEYDSIGRPVRTIKPNGSVEHTEYDVRDRITRLFVGTVDNIESSTLLREHWYDTDLSGVAHAGNGLLTHVRTYFTDTEYVDAIHHFDWRDREVGVEVASPDGSLANIAPTMVVHDNLDRVTAAASFSQRPDWSDPSGILVTHSRLSYVQTTLDVRGRPYTISTAVDPQDPLAGEFETQTWYDQRDRTLASTGPDEASVMAYDAHGRVVTAYSTAVDTSNQTFADATNVDDDRILKQNVSTYAPDSGLLEHVAVYRRTHDAQSTGDLRHAPVDDSIVTFNAYEYDAATRQTAQIAFGTGIDGPLQSGGAAPEPSGADPYTTWTVTGDEIIVRTEFDERGRPAVSIDPHGVRTRQFYDDLGRTVATVDNHQDVDIVWISAEQRWGVVGYAGRAPDTDRATTFVHDGVGNIIKRVAHNYVGTDERTQITTFEYAARLADGSKIDSNDILARVIYPDRETGLPGTAPTDQVVYQSDRAGRRIGMTDLNGVQHTYTLDAAGRVLRDDVDLNNAPEVDDTITAIESDFDIQGNLIAIRSMGAGQTRNEISFTHGRRSRLEAIAQEPFGETDAGSATVTFEYDESPATAGNYARLSAMHAPGGLTTGYDYGPPGSIDQSIGRVRAVTLPQQQDIIASYDYFGRSNIISVDLVIPDIRLDRQRSAQGALAPGVYEAFDRFGRLTDQRWVDGAFDVGSPYPPLVDLRAQYDAIGNRTAKQDRTPWHAATARHEAFEYDDLYRLTAAWRGVLEDADISTPFDPDAYQSLHPSSAGWALDHLNNQTSIRTNASLAEGDVVFASNESRQHNAMNELLERDDSQGVEAPLAMEYDAAGNLIRRELNNLAEPRPAYAYTYDAWHRLVEIDLDDGGTLKPAARYAYYGNNWRSVAQSDRHGASPADPPDGIIETSRTLFYDADWQLIESLIDDDAHLNNGPDRRITVVYGESGDNDIVARLQDDDLGGDIENTWFHLTDFIGSTVAVIDGGANIVERVSYDPYGRVRHHYRGDLNGDGAVTVGDLLILLGYTAPLGDLDQSGTADVADLLILLGDYGKVLAPGQLSITDNTFGFAGYQYDAAVQLYLARNRYYDPDLARWITRDPAGHIDGMNLYGYASANPLTMVDPLGLYSIFNRLATKSVNPQSVGRAAGSVAGKAATECAKFQANPIKYALVDNNPKDLAEDIVGGGLVDDILRANAIAGPDASGLESLLSFAAIRTGMQDLAEGIAGVDVAEKRLLGTLERGTRISFGTIQGALVVGGGAVTGSSLRGVGKAGLDATADVGIGSVRRSAIRDALSNSNGKLLSRQERVGLKFTIREVEKRGYRLDGSIKYRGNQGIDLAFTGTGENAGRFALAEAKSSRGLGSLKYDKDRIRQGSREFFATRLERAGRTDLQRSLAAGNVDLFGGFSGSGRLGQFNPVVFERKIDFRRRPDGINWLP